MEKITTNKEGYPQKRMTLKERLKYLVYQTEKDYILKPESPEEIERMIHDELIILNERDDNTDEHTKTDY